MHSARPLLSCAALVLAAAGPVAGCSTTQQEASRLQLNDARIRASQDSTRVGPGERTAAVVRASRVSLLRTPTGTAFVVTISNGGAKPVSDLPISTGYRLADRVVYLNAAPGVDYFNAHLPLVGAHRSITWVDPTGRSLPVGARPFVRVGATPSAHPGGLDMPPSIGAAERRLIGDRLTVALQNHTSIPQYQVPVYAFARRGGRYVAAGTATLAQLGSGADQRLRLTLAGSAGTARLVIEALPTIFR